MRKTRLIFLSVILLSLSTVHAQEKEDAAKKFEWTEEHIWNPPAELLRGMEQIGELNTHRKSLQLTSPNTLAATADGLLVFDTTLGKLLLFDTAGNFRESLFGEEQKISSPVDRISLDDDGRILLSDGRYFFLFDKGTITQIQNFHSLTEVVWDGEKIYGINPQMHERNEGLIKEISPEGEVLGTWGEHLWPASELMAFGLSSSTLLERKIVFCDYRVEGFSVLDLSSKSVKRIALGIEPLDRRVQLNNQCLEHFNETRELLGAPYKVFSDVVSLGTDLYLLVYDLKFLMVMVCNEEGEISAVYRGLLPDKGSVGEFAVTEVEGEPRFFFVSGSYKDKKYSSRVLIYAPCGQVPTPEDLEEKQEEPAKAEEKKKEERSTRREQYERYRELQKNIKATENEGEKRRIYLEFAEENPGGTYTPHALQMAAGREPDIDLAKKILEHVEVGLPKADEEQVQQRYLFLKLRLCMVIDSPEQIRQTAEELLKFDLGPYYYVTLLRDVAGIEDWDLLLRASERALQSMTPNNIEESYPNTPEEDKQRLSRHYRALFLIERGRALTNLGRSQEALTNFEAAEEISEKYYTGNFTNSLHLRWTEALEKAGRLDEAIDVLLPDAVFSLDDENTALLRRCFEAAGRSGNFEDFVHEQRLALARKIDDAVFYDYEGKSVKLSSVLGKATILTFWTPST